MRAALRPTCRDPLLDDAVWLFRASTETGRNEGTAGSALNPTSAVYVNGLEVPAFYGGQEAEASTCPDAAALDLTTGFVV